jgi:hypothetical protein
MHAAHGQAARIGGEFWALRQKATLQGHVMGFQYAFNNSA